MRCRVELEKLLIAISGSRYSVSELVSALLVISDMGPVGRVILSNILGIGDKKARNIIKELEKRGLVNVTRAGSIVSDKYASSISSILCATRSNYTVSIIPCDIGNENIIHLRDKIVLLLGTPDKLVAIGYSRKDHIEFPGIPSRFKDKLIRLVQGVRRYDVEAIAVFNTPRCYKCCSSFLQALTTSANRSATMSRSL